MIRTAAEYRDSLSAMKPNVYMNGEVLGRDNLPGTEIMELTCELAHVEAVKHLTTTTSHITGQPINRFCHIHQNQEDLLTKQEMTRMAARMVGCSAQTDVKGHRLRRPSKQTDPDLYLRVIEKKKDGIVVRGAKAHNSFAPLANEIIVTPTRLLGPEDKDWPVSFAIPGDYPGVKLVCRGAKYRDRISELASPFSGKGEIESLTIFDDVFVPWDRVFLCGEAEFGGQLALLFSLYHRHSHTARQ